VAALGAGKTGTACQAEAAASTAATTAIVTVTKSAFPAAAFRVV